MRNGFEKVFMGAAGSAGGGGTDVDEVFSTYLYTGTNNSNTITNGIDLDGEGGLVWIKNRTDSYGHYLFDSSSSWVKTGSTNGNGSYGGATGVFDGVSSTGFTVKSDFTGVNLLNKNYVSWTFRKAPKFFDVVTYSGNGTAGRTVSHNLGSVPGMIIVKRTNSGADWTVYHRGVASDAETDAVFLNTKSAAGDHPSYWNDTAPTDTVFSVGNGSEVNSGSGTYVAYLFAHNDGDGEFGPDSDQDIIKCGNYAGNSSSNGPEIDLGFEPQFVLLRNTGWSNGQFIMYDSMRGIVNGTGGDQLLYPAQTYAESADTQIRVTSTGFKLESDNYDVNNNFNYIYMAIRRGSLFPPEAATEVFAPNFYGTSGYVGYLGAPADMHMLGYRSGNSQNAITSSRMIQGNKALVTTSRAAEITTNSSWDNMSGVTTASSTITTLISWTWKRAPSFFDVVAYTGDGTTARAIPHNLGVAPEMMIHKRRNATNDWYVPDFINSKLLLLNYDAAAYDTSLLANYYGSGNGSSGGAGSVVTPNASTFTVTPNPNVNGSGDTYIAYLFATLAGVSKVGSVTHSGTTNVDCGFSAGSRFVMLKRTDATGDWYVWDSVRGIIAGNDPYLLLNSTAAEVTNTDYIDPLTSGFTISDNFTDGDYIFYAIA